MGKSEITFTSILPLSKLLYLKFDQFRPSPTHHLITQYFLSSNSKIQKYSPNESAKVYDKAVNRKSNVHFHPRQTIDFISNNMARASLSNDVKRRIVRQYLDVSNEAPSDFSLSVFLYITDCQFICFWVFSPET